MPADLTRYDGASARAPAPPKGAAGNAVVDAADPVNQADANHARLRQKLAAHRLEEGRAVGRRDRRRQVYQRSQLLIVQADHWWKSPTV
jgi:hypothetical protein